MSKLTSILLLIIFCSTLIACNYKKSVEGDGIYDEDNMEPEMPIGYSSNYELWSTSNFDFNQYNTAAIDFIKNNINPICWEQRPKTINGLTDGVIIESYFFDKNNERDLGIFGFKVNLKKKQKVVIVEFSQEGTQYCDNKSYKYGVGARMMLHIVSSKKGAKLNTPQQITASVIFGKAEVIYSLKTFGIVGPGVANLNKATGSYSEDTYQDFMGEISNLIVEMYNKDSTFIVTPQPLYSNKQTGV